MKLNSLKFKVLLWFIGAVSVVLISFSFLLSYFMQESINLKIQNNLYYSARDMLDEIEENKLNEITFRYEKANHIEALIVRENEIIKQTENFKAINIYDYMNKEQIFFIEESDEHTVNVIYVLNFEKPFKGSIILMKKGLPNKAEDVQDILFILNPIFLLILIFIGNRVINKVLIPIENITQSAKQINIDNLTQEIKSDQKEEEIKELIDTFNAMIKRLKSGVERMDRFNNDVSHELRTPLTVINTQVELALKKDREEEYYKKSLMKIGDESNKMKQMVHDMLLLTKYTKDNIQETFALCDLNAVLMDCIEKFMAVAVKKEITLEIKEFQRAKLQVNSSLMVFLFSNLIDNAIKYTPNRKNIFLSLHVENGIVSFIIQDEGIGIPKELIGKVTERFFRVDESRNKSIKGFGLGLSLVKNIVELHNAQMTIESETSIGTTITITF